MRVKPVLVLAFCAVVSVSSLAPRAWTKELTKEDKIRLLLTMMKPDNGMMDEMIQRMTQGMQAAATMGIVPPQSSRISPEEAVRQRARLQAIQLKLVDLVKDRMSLERIIPLCVPIYADTFTESEIDGMLAFYQSPAGHALTEKMPVMLPKIIQVMQQQMQELQPEFQRIIMESVTQPASH